MIGRMFAGRSGGPAEAEERRGLEVALGRCSILEGLGASQLAALVPALRSKRFQDEAIVCHCPDAAHDAFVLLSGSVALTREKQGLIHVVQLERPGAVFNLGPLLGLTVDRAGARALGPVEVLAVDSALLKKKLARDPKLGYRLVSNLSRLALWQCEGQLDRYLA